MEEPKKRGYDAGAILDRVKESRNMRSDTDLARALDVAPTTISSWRARGSIDFDKLFAYLDGDDLNYIIRGGSSEAVTKATVQVLGSVASHLDAYTLDQVAEVLKKLAKAPRS